MIRIGACLVVASQFLQMAAGAAGLTSAPTPPSAASIDFFEKQIRPILVDHCYKCHSAASEKLKGGLRLDTRDEVLRGGDSGPAIVPGDPEKSLLIKAIRYTDENLQMPPKNARLSVQQIADLEAWVKMGAPDPRGSADPGVAKNSSLARSNHWAFRPVCATTAPPIKSEAKIRTPVDRFILSKLEAQGLELSPIADKRTLIRRVTYDLTGLPPTSDEVYAFELDSTPDAYSRVVDRLLASPRYGERWGRYWLDVARYADTKGYVFEEERRYAYAYTYRDWVIRAFNEDLPYDQFLIQQIAADRLLLGDDKRPLAALGFLTLGRRFLNSVPDIIDDRIDVVCRGTMALTVGCARCHDHKFDPIPTKDYYSLYGIFSSSHEPNEKPLLGTNSFTKAYPVYVAERAKREAELTGYQQARMEEALRKLRSQVGDYLLAVHIDSKTKKVDADGLDSIARERQLDPPTAKGWKNALNETATQRDPILLAWRTFSELDPSNWMASARIALTALQTNSLNTEIVRVLADPSNAVPASLKEVASAYNRVFMEVDAEWRALTRSSNGAAATESSLPNPEREALRQWLYRPHSPISTNYDDLHRVFETVAQQKIRALRRSVEELDATHVGAPPRAMVLLDNSTPDKPRVFKRGNPNSPGDEVPRQFLEILSGPNRNPFVEGSGRLELARAIVSRDNPLTARVLVNRVWMHHFGSPLVRTPADFGVRSDPPTHPELLDYLSARFMDEGWSIKKLHRQLLLSATYQQISEPNPKGAQRDPSNQWYGRMNRQRLDFEAMRDTLLALAGSLDLTPCGQSVEIASDSSPPRRTIYGFVERQNLPGLFRTFDFASPDSTTAQRFSTTVPQQALFLMNSPFVIQQSRNLLQRSEVVGVEAEDEKLRRLFRIMFQRQPEQDEIRLAHTFLAGQKSRRPRSSAPAAWESGYAGLQALVSQRMSRTPLREFSDRESGNNGDMRELDEFSDKDHFRSPLAEPAGVPSLTPWEKFAQVLLLTNELMFVD